ncbi:hypothetical protein KAR91_59665 [Candidatus Pacearchaeota archaeon]|nr:hypothetical protein [Candidatus Pacearchaeota archaeon]
MGYHIAKKDVLTGSFVLLKDSKTGDPITYYSKTEAIEQYQLGIEVSGRENTRLVENVPLTVTVIAKIRED